MQNLQNTVNFGELGVTGVTFLKNLSFSNKTLSKTFGLQCFFENSELHLLLHLTLHLFFRCNILGATCCSERQFFIATPQFIEVHHGLLWGTVFLALPFCRNVTIICRIVAL